MRDENVVNDVESSMSSTVNKEITTAVNNHDSETTLACFMYDVKYKNAVENHDLSGGAHLFKKPDLFLAVSF